MRAAIGPVRAVPMMRMMMMNRAEPHGLMSNGKSPWASTRPAFSPLL